MKQAAFLVLVYVAGRLVVAPKALSAWREAAEVVVRVKAGLALPSGRWVKVSGSAAFQAGEVPQPWVVLVLKVEAGQEAAQAALLPLARVIRPTGRPARVPAPGGAPGAAFEAVNGAG